MEGKHWIVLGIFFLLATSILLSGTTWIRADQGAPILLGAPIPRASAYGQNGERGMILAAEEINAAGGIKVGGLMRPLKLEIIDTRDEEPGVPAGELLLSLEKLILQKKVDFVVGGPLMSEWGIAAMDLFAKYKVLDLVSIGCFTPTWDQEFAKAPDKYKYSFRESGSVKWYIKEAVDLLEKIKKEHGFTKMYISIDDSLMCRKATEIVEGIVTKQGWTILGFDKHPSGTTDYSVLMSNVKKSGAQVLFLWAYAPESSILLRQWADMEVPALPLGFIGAAEDPGFWEATKGKGAYTIVNLTETGATPSNVTPKTMKYFDAYKKRWRVEPRSRGSVSAYEVLYVLKNAIERTGSLDKEKLIAALETTNLQGVRGTLRFDQNHQIVYGYDPNTSVLGNWAQWQDGKRVTIFPEAAATGKIMMPPWLKK